MNSPRYPMLYQLNTRVRLTELSEKLGRAATLDDFTDAELDEIEARGFDWVWLLSVWQTGTVAQKISRSNPEWKHDFELTLPDLKDDDIAGSGFAICDYSVHKGLGGEESLAKLRERLRKRGLKLMLDFVPNHMAPDHHWVKTNPEYFVAGTEQDLANAPQNYTRIGDRVFAYGRDPYFSGWPDTLQLNYANPETQKAMTNELLRIAACCDGVRCDMAMLILPEIFERTWGQRSQSFWPEATDAVRQKHQDFKFMAEVYWDMEWALQQLGFDYTYDKRLYDRLREGSARAVREHLLAPLDYQDKMARFLENHDEPRAANTFSNEMHKAAAVITFFSPGLRFFHQGQMDGRKKRISPHLVRAPREPVIQELKKFYEQLLPALKHKSVRQGQWRLLESRPAWEENWTAACFVCFSWQGPADERLLVLVNYAQNQSQCYVKPEFENLNGKQWQLRDLLSDEVYERDGDELADRGLFLDMKPWQAQLLLLSSS